MAAITTRLHHLRPIPRSLRYFSSPSDPPEPVSEPDSNQTRSKPTFASYLNDVKASLQREPHPHDRPRRPLSNTSQPPPSLDGIRRSLAGYRLRSAAPSSSSSSGHHVSFRELYKSNVISKSDDAVKPLSFDSIRDSLRNMPKNRNDVGGRSGEVRSEPLIFGGSDGDGGGGGISSAVFMKEKKNAGGMKSALFKSYAHADLGRKLETLRPEKTKKKGDWFSLQELNERLVRLREIEEKESQGKTGGVTFRDLRESLAKMNRSEEEQKREETMQRLEALSQLGTTPGIMLSAPKEHLVEKYFHPDNMSSAEKLKLELKKVRDEFKMSESDCGSARVQVAQLTTKIKHLSTVLQKKDKHSRKGLQAMVQRRKKLLKYLRRTDWDSYSLVLSKLGLRDNPDIKIKA